jgi:hypothetical protein
VQRRRGRGFDVVVVVVSSEMGEHVVVVDRCVGGSSGILLRWYRRGLYVLLLYDGNARDMLDRCDTCDIKLSTMEV